MADEVRVFRNDDKGFIAWRDRHPDGVVLSADPSFTDASAMRVHVARCGTLRGRADGTSLTGSALKACAPTGVVLAEWIKREHGVDVRGRGCRICRPALQRPRV